MTTAGADPAPRLRLCWSADSCEVWPEDQPTDYAPDKLAKSLNSWHFQTEHHGPRPATEKELKGIEGFGGDSLTELLRKRGVIWYEWPVRFQRTADRVDGRAFDQLRSEAAAFQNVVTVDRLLELLQKVRFRNLPAGRNARDYTC